MNDSIITFQKNIKDLLLFKGAIYLRGAWGKDGDIDFYVEKNNFSVIESALLKNGFIKFQSSDSKISFYNYVFNHILIIDIALNFNYIFKNFKNVNFTRNFIHNYINNLEENNLSFNTIRYLFMERRNQKYVDFFKNNKKNIIANNFFLENININPFKETSNFSYKVIKNIIRKNKITYFRYLKINFKIQYLKEKVLFYLNLFNSGKSIAFIGADGVGKTTIIGVLVQLKNCRTIYMGSNDFIFGEFYNLLDTNRTIFFRLVKFIMVYFENIIKLIQIKWHCTLGRTVLLDRHPSYNYFLQKPPGLFLSKLFYKYLFPKPHKVVILYCDSKEIMERKNELDKKTISELYSSWDLNLKNDKKVCWVENIDINNTIKQIIDEVGL